MRPKTLTTKASIRGVGLLAVFGCLIGTSHATTIGFVGAAAGNNSDIPSSYCSNASTDGTGWSVSDGTGATPGIGLIWAGGANVWEYHTSTVWNHVESNTVGGAWDANPGTSIVQLQGNGSGNLQLNFATGAGIALVLNSFDIGNATDQTEPDYALDITLVRDSDSAVVWSNATAALGPGDVEAVAVGYTGDAGEDYTLNFDRVGGTLSYRTALDNLSFSQDPPASTNNIIMGDASYSLELTADGRFVSLFDHTTSTIVATNQGSLLPAWVIHKEGGGLITSDDYPYPVVSSNSNTLDLEWQAPSLPTVSAKVEYVPADSEFRFSLTNINNLSSSTLDRWRFPNGLQFEKTAGNYVAMSVTKDWASPLIDLAGLGTIEDLVYPGYLQMQMIGFKVGGSSLLVYPDDAAAHVKYYNLNELAGGVEFNHQSFIHLLPGQQTQLPYDYVYKMIPGGTFLELAQEYGQWGRQQWWATNSYADKVANTPLLQHYNEHGYARVHTHAEYGQPVPLGPWVLTNGVSNLYESEVLDLGDLYEQEYGIHPGYWYPSWHGHKFDTFYPDYFPVGSHMGSFTNLHAQLIQTERPMMYHINMVHWDTNAPSFNLADMSSWNGSYLWRMHSDVWHVYTSPSLTLAREMQTLNQIKDSAGVNGVYLDVFGHMFRGDNNPAADHYDQPNGYQLVKQDTFKAVRATITGPMMTESRNEILLPYIDIGFGTAGEAHEDHVPLWELVYGDIIATAPFIDKCYSYAKRSKNHTRLVGGITELARPVDGTDCDVYDCATKQYIFRDTVGTLMLDHRRVGWLRESVWTNCHVVVHRDEGSSAVNHSTSSHVGSIDVTSLDPKGIAIVRDAENFALDGGTKLELDGTLLVEISNKEVSVVRTPSQWFIWNQSAGSVSVTIKTPVQMGTIAQEVKTQQWLTPSVIYFGGVYQYSISLDAGDGLIIPPGSVGPLGTPEWWLWSHGLTNGTSAEEELLDGDTDGMLTWEEWVSDTDPTDGNSVLKITDIQSTGSTSMQVDWQGGVEATQWLERRTNLVSGSWMPLLTNEPPTSVTTNFVDSTATNSAEFYRIKAGR